jgi:hypothetical protein
MTTTPQLLNFDPTLHSDADSIRIPKMMRINIRNTGTQNCRAKNISFGSGSGRQSNFGSSALGSGSTTLLEKKYGSIYQ